MTPLRFAHFNMLQYIYSPQEAGLPEWPSGTLRLTGIEITQDPTKADIFVVPGMLTTLFPAKSDLEKLAYFKEYESKHCVFDCSDNEQLYGTTAMLIRCNVRTWFLQKDPNTLSFPWPVEDYSECIDIPEDGFKYDISFQGWNYSGVRQASTRSCEDTSGLKLDFAKYPDFCGYIYDQPEGIRRRAEFRRSMRESRLCLCPESIPGVFPYRFWEAMSAARVPMLIGSGYVLPFVEEIPYGNFCIFLPSDMAHDAGPMARSILNEVSDARLIEMGREGRYYFDKLLHRDKWPQLMAYAVQKKLSCPVATL